MSKFGYFVKLHDNPLKRGSCRIKLDYNDKSIIADINLESGDSHDIKIISKGVTPYNNGGVKPKYEMTAAQQRVIYDNIITSIVNNGTIINGRAHIGTSCSIPKGDYRCTLLSYKVGAKIIIRRDDSVIRDIFSRHPGVVSLFDWNVIENKLRNSAVVLWISNSKGLMSYNIYTSFICDGCKDHGSLIDVIPATSASFGGSHSVLNDFMRELFIGNIDAVCDRFDIDKTKILNLKQILRNTDMEEMIKLKKNAISKIAERSDKYNVIIKKLDPKSETINSEIIIRVKYGADITGSKPIYGVIPVKVLVNLNTDSKKCSSSISTNIKAAALEELKSVDSIKKGPYIGSIADEVERQVMAFISKMFNTKVVAEAYSKIKTEIDTLPESVIKVRCSIEEYKINSTASGNVVFLDSKHNKILECNIRKVTCDGKSKDTCNIVNGTMELDPATLYAGLIKTDKENVFRVGPKVFSGIIDLAMKEFDISSREVMLSKMRSKRAFVLVAGSKVMPELNYVAVADIFNSSNVEAYMRNHTENLEEVSKKGKVVRVKRKS